MAICETLQHGQACCPARDTGKANTCKLAKCWMRICELWQGSSSSSSPGCVTRWWLPVRDAFVRGTWCTCCCSSVQDTGCVRHVVWGPDRKMTRVIVSPCHRDWFCSPEAEGRKGNVPLWSELGRKGKQLVGRRVDARVLHLPTWTLEPLRYINHGKCVCFSHCVRVRKP